MLSAQKTCQDAVAIFTVRTCRHNMKTSQRYLKFRISSKEFRTAEVTVTLRNSIFLVQYPVVQNHLEFQDVTNVREGLS
jgi:hypothetical protein